ncbi:MAG: small multi-drug export protein [Clostridia bacterium]|nr:small multi-drug export protein [Clostridia bacterium]
MQDFFLSFFESLGNLPREIIVLFMSMVPVVELRGAIPVGATLGLSTFSTFVYAVIGNCLPVPFIILLARPLVNYLKKTRVLGWFARWMEKKTEKNRDKIMKRSAFGLFLFVAIPLPGTGAWTGALCAALLDMRFRFALPSIIGGVLAAGCIMTVGTEFVKWIIQIF